MPQGSVLGPLLFLLYINDLHNVNPLDEFILIADDTTCVTSPQSLQTACDRISVWFNANKLALNVKKTNHMLFSLKNDAVPVVKLHQNYVSNVTSFKFLGCYIDCALSRKYNCDSVCKKC